MMGQKLVSSSSTSASSSSALDVLQKFDEYSENVDDEKITTVNNNNSSNKSTQYYYYCNNYEFTPKFTKSCKNNPLFGICFGSWMEILYARWYQIEFQTYWPRVVVITCLSIFNSILGWIEYWWFDSSTIRQTQVHPSPVFILGHPRTGTTLLHSLLALDDEQFDVCTTFCSGFPSSFLWFERIGKILFSGLLDDTRPMDNVTLDFDLPQEDELATNLLTSGTCSPYMPLFFMQQESDFRPYYAFDDAAKGDESLPPHEMAQARKRWCTAFYYLCQKLTLRGIMFRDGESKREQQQSPRRRLLLKSPVHTARISLLLRIFPNAQFIYIHRHPYDVFRSAVHMADTTYWYTYLNTPTNQQIMDFIVRQYEILWDRYEEGRRILLLEQQQQQQQQQPTHNQLIEISYEELSQNPMDTIQKIYKELGWTLSPTYQQKLETVIQNDVKTYQKNRYHKDLDPIMKSTLQKRWGDSFDRLGYKR